MIISDARVIPIGKHNTDNTNFFLVFFMADKKKYPPLLEKDIKFVMVMVAVAKPVTVLMK